jgi:hypothetical protein
MDNMLRSLKGIFINEGGYNKGVFKIKFIVRRLEEKISLI